MRRIDIISTILLLAAFIIAVLMIYSVYTYITYQTYEVTKGSVSGSIKENYGNTEYSSPKMPVFMIKNSSIIYEYEAGGVYYQGRIGQVAGQRNLKKRDFIVVYFDPKNPAKSVLDLEFKYGQFIVWVVFFIAVILFEYLWYRFRLQYYEKPKGEFIYDELWGIRRK